MIGILREKLSFLMGRLGVRSEEQVQRPDRYEPSGGHDPRAPYDQTDYGQAEGYDQQTAYAQTAYVQQAGYGQAEAQSEYEEPVFETGYGSGYTTAGARPVSASRQKSESIFSALKSRLSRPQEPDYGQPPPDNVVPLTRPGADGPDARSYGAQTPHGGFEQAPDAPAARRENTGKTLIQLVRRMEDAKVIIEHMISGGKVILNMEDIDDALKRRMVDMISGAAFALQYNVEHFAYSNYLVTPSDEDIIMSVSTRDAQDTYYEQEPQRASGRRFY